MATENTPVAVATVEAFMAALIQAWPTGERHWVGSVLQQGLPEWSAPIGADKRGHRGELG
jgi:hypothetical protein